MTQSSDFSTFPDRQSGVRLAVPPKLSPAIPILKAPLPCSFLRTTVVNNYSEYKDIKSIREHAMRYTSDQQGVARVGVH